MPVRIADWTVDYGQGPAPCRVPHAWRQDVDVRWEGPAVYRTTVQVPECGGHLVFWGVSYRARVRLSPIPPAPEVSGSRLVGKEGGRGMEVAAEPATAEKRVGSRPEGPESPSPTPPSLSPGVENEGGAPETSPPTPSLFSLGERGEGVFEHHGIWDAFTVPLAGFEGQTVEVEVEVVKNGGPTFPVKDVASGFLPYVFNTFGGIWQAVELWETEPDLAPPATPCRVKVEGTKIFVDGKPFYLRGVLTWGWYPELGNHPCPDEETIRREVRLMKELGFNTCKFCLWVPPHRYFEILEEEGMFAWMELPLWDPTPDPDKQEAMFDELRRIVLQYRRHSNIVVWTCGCELSSNTTADYRRRLYEMVKELTGAALVKDNSGSSEMYGGDLREYGDFYDFHPYCDLPFYPVVLDSLLVGPREKKPILLGEFNDIDVHRDLPRIKREMPFWATDDPVLADQGARWFPPELPRIIRESRWAEGGYEGEFSSLSLAKASFIRETVQETVRAREDITGYVVTGWRDTPISTAGVVDDWGQHRDGRIQIWNGAECLFPISFRKPPWVHGGNRPGWLDPWNYFEGDLSLYLGLHADSDLSGSLRWSLDSVKGFPKTVVTRIAEGNGPALGFRADEPAVAALISLPPLSAGNYYLKAQFAEKLIVGHFLRVVSRPEFKEMAGWRLEDPSGQFFGLELPGGPHQVCLGLPVRIDESAVLILVDKATRPAPFWRESALDWPLGMDHAPVGPDWKTLLSVSGDRVIDLPSLLEALPNLKNVQVLINRIDTRTYAEAPVLIKAKVGNGTLVATTLRPFGGLGCQPYGVMNNPAGADLLVKLIRMAEEG